MSSEEHHELGEQQETIYRNGTDKRRGLLDLLIVLMVPAVGWLFTEAIENGKFRERTDSNRYTSGEALRDLGSINERLARIEIAITEIPPSWFLRQVQNIELQVQDIDKRLETVERK